MNTRTIIAGLLILGGLPAPGLYAQFTTDYETNTISGVFSNWDESAGYIVGDTNSFDVLQIDSGGILTNSLGYIGYDVSASNNLAIITDSGSIWSNGALVVGYSGSGNQLIITNGGTADDYIGTVGYNSSSSNNLVWVSDPGSLWTNRYAFYVGYDGSFNQLIITNGGKTIGGTIDINEGLGEHPGANGNLIRVVGTNETTGAASTLTVTPLAALAVGAKGSSNRLEIIDGGVVTITNDNLLVGWTNPAVANVVLVTGTNSALRGTQAAFIGALNGADANQMIVSNAGLAAFSSTINVGYRSSSNQLFVVDGGIARSANGFIGEDPLALYNSALIAGTGSQWTNTSGMTVGLSGRSNSLTVADSGLVVNNTGTIGVNSDATNNAVLVTDAGSIWRNNGTLTVGFNGTGNSLTVSNGGLVIVASEVHVGNNGTAAGNVVYVTGPGSVLTNTGTLTIGVSGHDNMLVITNGGRVSSTIDAQVGSNTGGSSNLAIVAGSSGNFTSTWQLAGGSLYVGSSGSTNRLVIADGAKVSDAAGYIGWASGANRNSVLVTDQGTVWTNTGSLYVGYGGAQGSLIISNGALVSANSSVYLSRGGFGNAATITGNGSTLRANSELLLDDVCCNSLIVEQGAKLFYSSASGFQVGYDISYNNVLRVDGAGSQVQSTTAGGNFVIGSGGANNSMTITNGGFVQTADSSIGNSSAANANKVTVMGIDAANNATSTWTVGTIRPIIVGSSGSRNSVQILEGGRVVDGTGTIGDGSVGSSNSVLVSGSLSIWTNSTTLTVGNHGAYHSLTLSNGGAVVSGTGTIGNNVTASSNTVLVTGSNSRWLNYGTLTVGNLGRSNTLTIADAGSVLTTNRMLIGAPQTCGDNLVRVTGGNLTVTNTAGNAVLEVRSGTLIIENAGIVTANTLVMTNTCGRLLLTGATLSVNTTNLAAALDADGDGLPNSWETSYGLSPFSDTGNDGAGGDPDGDGFTNLQEYLAGTNPQLDDRENSWSSASSGKWETGVNWLLTIPPASNQAVFVTNTTTKIVTIDATTVLSNTLNGCMTVSNLTVAGLAGTINTLQLTNAGVAIPLRVLGSFSITNGGALLVTNAAIQVNGESAGGFNIDSAATMQAGALVVATNVVVGTLAGAQGTLTVAGGTNQFTSFLAVGSVADSTGSVWMIDGQLSVAANTVIGSFGVGQLILSNGTVIATNVFVGSNAGSWGKLTMAGGANHLTGRLVIGNNLGATGAVWMTGGELLVTHDNTLIGRTGVGEMTVSNGTWLTRGAVVGQNVGGAGTLTLAGGTGNVFSNLTIGNFPCTPTGAVVVASGTLTVTNATSDAVLEVRSGTLTLSGGLLIIDQLVITNACARFIQTGGTLSVTSTNLDPTLDADGDGLPNGWETSFGLSPFSDIGNDGANGDPDGDGFTNLQEYNAGRNPLLDDSINSWTSAASGKWETGANWLLTLPPSSNQTVFVTNTTTKTVTIDATTVATNAGTTMTISNLTVSAVAGSTNILLLSDTGLGTPFRVLNGLTIGSGGRLDLTNSMLQVDGLTGGSNVINGTLNVLGNGVVTTNVLYTVVGSLAGTSGQIGLDGGSLFVRNNFIVGAVTNSAGAVWMSGENAELRTPTLWIGYKGTGQLTVSNGTWLASGAVQLGTFPGSQGTLTLAGGTNKLSNTLLVGGGVNCTGVVWLTGSTAQLETTNVFFPTSYIGYSSIGWMTVSNGTWLARSLVIGDLTGSQGTLTLAGGMTHLASFLSVGSSGTGTVWLTGGSAQLVTTNSQSNVGIGYPGVGSMTMSNGIWLANGVTVGAALTAQGTLTVAGGISSVSSNLTIGNFGCTATGTVIVAGGSLFVTNALTNAVLEVRSGTVRLDAGTLLIDQLVITNACGHFNRIGGTLQATTVVLSPALDADGDGLPNDWEQANGLDPLSAVGVNGAGGDPDGDGLTNLQEYQAGSTPGVDLKSIIRENDDIRVTWQAVATKTNALQWTAGFGGSYSNNFADVFIVTNNIGSVTNYLDSGAATNVPARYYRIRLSP